jgi:hypothetical protein
MQGSATRRDSALEALLPIYLFSLIIIARTGKTFWNGGELEQLEMLAISSSSSSTRPFTLSSILATQNRARNISSIWVWKQGDVQLKQSTFGCPIPGSA